MQNRQTKIVWSFAAHSLSDDLALRAVREDVEALRVVYDRRQADTIVGFFKAYKSHRVEGRAPLMLDISSWTQGTLIGLEERDVSFGDEFTVTPAGGGGDWEIETPLWEKVFTKSSTVYLGYGSVVLKVRDLSPVQAKLEVIQGGTVYDKMDVYVPDTRYHPSIRNIQPDDFAAFEGCRIDHLVIPGQWSSEEIRGFRDDLRARVKEEETPWLIAKVDSRNVYDRLKEILPEVEGILISRRELALTVNPATVPMITKEIIQLCNDRAKVVITASEMLASMRRNSTPTRAEVSDIANAVMDGTDAVILSEEVAEKQYGDRALEVMRRIILDIEAQSLSSPNWIKAAPAIETEMDAISHNAYRTAQRIGASAIVCITHSGNTALRLSSYRIPIPVIAVTFSEAVRDKLALVRGIEAMLLDIEPQIDDVLPTVNDQLLARSWLKKGDQVIFVSVTLSPIGEKASNLFTIQKLE